MYSFAEEDGDGIAASCGVADQSTDDEASGMQRARAPFCDTSVGPFRAFVTFLV